MRFDSTTLGMGTIVRTSSFLIGLITTTVLVGCATPQERAASAIKKHGPYCQALGLEPGTPPFAGCVQQEVARVQAAFDAYDTQSKVNRLRAR